MRPRNGNAIPTAEDGYPILVVRGLDVRPVTLKEANAYVDLLHRHHGSVVGHKFAIRAIDPVGTVGVCIVGRPVARMLDDGVTAEVLRLCTDGTRNACSLLYGAAARAAFAMGYARIVTYILESERGASLRAAGWQRADVDSRGGTWSRPSRGRQDSHPTEPKSRYERLRGR